MPVFRYFYLKNNSSINVQATITLPGVAAQAYNVSPPVVPGLPFPSHTPRRHLTRTGQSARVDLLPTAPDKELHNLGLGVIAADVKTESSSAGSFFTYEPGSAATLYTSVTGKDGLSISFDGYGNDPAPHGGT